VHAQKYELFASEVVILEILRDPNPQHRQKLLDALHRHPVAMLPSNLEIERLADLYLARGIIPAKKREDALHVAHATVHGLDIIVVMELQTSGQCPPRRLDRRREPAGGLLARFAAALAAGGGR
jgi:hypothetical protein